MKTAAYIVDNEVLGCGTELIQQIAAGGLTPHSLKASSLLSSKNGDEGDDMNSHWLVSDWLVEKLQAKGERVERDFAGLAVWGRAVGGRPIWMDDVICQTAADCGATSPAPYNA